MYTLYAYRCQHVYEIVADEREKCRQNRSQFITAKTTAETRRLTKSMFNIRSHGKWQANAFLNSFHSFDIDKRNKGYLLSDATSFKTDFAISFCLWTKSNFRCIALFLFLISFASKIFVFNSLPLNHNIIGWVSRTHLKPQLFYLYYKFSFCSLFFFFQVLPEFVSRCRNYIRNEIKP